MIKVNQLTARRVATLTKPGLHADGLRLYLQVTKTGAKSWVFRYGFKGRTYNMGLGSAYVVPLAEARKRAQAASMQLTDGINPIEQKWAQRATRQIVQEKTKPFAICANGFIAAHRTKWTGRYEAHKWIQSLEDFANPHIGKMPVRAIATSDIMRVLQPIWTTKHQTAKKLRGRIENILDWAKAQDLRSGENPASRAAVKYLLPDQATEVRNHPSLPWAEVGEFYRSLQADTSIPCRALELLILTALRSNEVLGARWEEFDLANRVWHVPGKRMKEKRPHDVPLSSAAMKLLTGMLVVAGNPYVFPGMSSGGRLTATAMQRWIRVSLANDVITVHGFRSTFRTWGDECTNTPTHILEMALAHAVGTNVEKIYRRTELLDKRRILMEEWGEFVTRPPAMVIPLRASGD